MLLLYYHLQYKKEQLSGERKCTLLLFLCGHLLLIFLCTKHEFTAKKPYQTKWMLRSIPDWILHSKQPHARVELRNVKNLLLQISHSVHRWCWSGVDGRYHLLLENSFLHIFGTKQQNGPPSLMYTCHLVILCNS